MTLPPASAPRHPEDRPANRTFRSVTTCGKPGQHGARGRMASNHLVAGRVLPGAPTPSAHTRPRRVSNCPAGRADESALDAPADDRRRPARAASSRSPAAAHGQPRPSRDPRGPQPHRRRGHRDVLAAGGYYAQAIDDARETDDHQVAVIAYGHAAQLAATEAAVHAAADDRPLLGTHSTALTPTRRQMVQ